MKRTRRITALILAIPAILAVTALPAGAGAPGSGVPKTSEEHPAWLLLDPVVEQTDAKQVTISGRVAGNFDMKITNWEFERTFQASGFFSAQVELFGGVNHIWLTGNDRAGRVISQEIVVVCTALPDKVSLSIDRPLVANLVSTATITATVLDVTGGMARGYNGAVTFTSSDPAVVKIVNAASAAVNGVATATLQAAAVAAPVTITVTAAGLPDATIQITPAPQVPTLITLRADPSRLAASGDSLGTLYLRAIDQTGTQMLSMPGPVMVQLRSSNSGYIHFGSDQATLNVMVTAPVSPVTIYGGFAAGTATISGVAQTADGTAVTVQSTTVDSIVIGVPYRATIDPIPTAPEGTMQQAAVRLLDIFGNQVSDATGWATLNVTLTKPDGTSVLLGTVSLNYGYGVFAFVNPEAGTYTLTVSGKWKGWPIQSGQTTFTVTP